MGNSQTKEARPPPSPSNSRHPSLRPGDAAPSERDDAAAHQTTDRPAFPVYGGRHRGNSRPDLSFLGIGGSHDREVAGLEARRETRQEREARKLERERAARIKERERSMREEHVDGGYLVTQGVYVGAEDFNKAIVRQLMIERRIAPFWRGLNDFSESWAEHQLMAAARGLPIPPPDEVPPELEYRISPRTKDEPRASEKALKSLTVPISSRSHSYNSDSSSNLSPNHPAFSLPSPTSPLASPPSASGLFRGRAKTLASLTTSSKNNSQTDMTPRELQLPKDPFVNGQPIEAYLYKDASECPICFLYYPPYLNMTRCCDQPICSECFVQIKRPDPHPPEHEQDDPNSPAPPRADQENEADGQLVSEPATCPFCKQPEFGITYAPPPFRRGLTYASSSGSHPLTNAASAMSSQSSLASAGNGTHLSPGPTRRRATSLSATAPSVITTDKIRPDWATKLASARAHAARRSAAATALHTAAYLMGNSNGQNSDTSRFAGFGRRGMLRRPTENGGDSPSGGTNSSHLNALALLAERSQQREEGGGESGRPSAMFLPPPRGSSSRRSRMDDLEDMMMMEAIRLSLASEEERRRKEEKEAQKEAKKKEKERRKAEKAAKKSGLYTASSDQSNTGFDSPVSGTFGHVESGSSSIFGDEPAATGKGKAVDRVGSSTPSPTGQDPSPSSANVPGISLSKSDAEQSAPLPIPSSLSDPPRRSHLRHMSNASSSASSFVDARSGSALDDPITSNTPPGGGAGTEPMFNFHSLAAMIGDEEKGEESSHVENAEGINGDSAASHAGDDNLTKLSQAASETNEKSGSASTSKQAPVPGASNDHINGIADEALTS